MFDTSLFFELIQLSLDKRDSFCLCPSEQEWGELFELAKKQALVGVLFSGVERLPENQRPPKEVLLKWYALVQKIEERNRVLNRQVVAVSERFMRDGFCSCILKGQGNAALYPNPLRRQSGDIDIWLCHKDHCGNLNLGLCERRDRVVEYIKSKSNVKEVVYHHADFKILQDTEIEVHFTPSWMFNPFQNRKLQRFFRNQEREIFTQKNSLHGIDDGEVCIPSYNFNVIYLLIHIYRHLFVEGIGLRQLMDYYFLVRSSGVQEFRSSDGTQSIMNYEFASLVKGSSGVQKSDFKFLSSLVLKFLSCLPCNLIYRNSDGERNCLDGRTDEQNDWTSNCGEENCEMIELLKSLKLYKFARAVMWVLGEVFGLERELMYVEPDEKEGRFLLNEIMMAGNFGKYDDRIKYNSSRSRFHSLMRRHIQASRFLRSYPQEVVWELPFRGCHYIWRWYKGYL